VYLGLHVADILKFTFLEITYQNIRVFRYISAVLHAVAAALQPLLERAGCAGDVCWRERERGSE